MRDEGQLALGYYCRCVRVEAATLYIATMVSTMLVSVARPSLSGSRILKQVRTCMEWRVRGLKLPGNNAAPRRS